MVAALLSCSRLFLSSAASALAAVCRRRSHSFLLAGLFIPAPAPLESQRSLAGYLVVGRARQLLPWLRASLLRSVVGLVAGQVGAQVGILSEGSI